MGEVVKFEDWTHADPLVVENRLLRQDIAMMAREIARLRRIECAAAELKEMVAQEKIRPFSPLACQAIVDLGSALMPVCWGRRG